MKLHEQLGIDMGGIEEMLLAVIRSDQDLPRPSVIYDAIEGMIRSGGKRLRPMMVLTGGKFGSNANARRLHRTAAMLEYLHMASLIHDDIIDGSDTRRGQPAVHMKTGIPAAIRIANYMMARAVEWASSGDLGETARTSSLAAVVTQLCLGEYQQLSHRFDYDMSLDVYLQKTRNKTAQLMAVCLKSGAECAGADRETQELLERFGDTLGTAFQIRDDVLDFTQLAKILGKPAGADLRSGNVTLPVLYALENPRLSPVIRALNEDSSDEEFQSAVELIAGSDAIHRSLELSSHYIEQAKLMIRSLRNYPAHKDLETLLNYFVNREK